jgi:hypothetical protein
VALTLSAPSQSCVTLPDSHPYKGYGTMKDYINFAYFQMLAGDCGLPVGTVKLTPPALTTCEGAVGKFMSVGRCRRTCMYARRMLCGALTRVCA